MNTVVAVLTTSCSATPYEAIVSGDALPLSSAGIDVYCDGAGFTLHHDYTSGRND